MKTTCRLHHDLVHRAASDCRSTTRTLVKADGRHDYVRAVRVAARGRYPAARRDQEVTTMTSKPSAFRTAARVTLGVALTGLGVAHLTAGRKPFKAQVPRRLAKAVPASTDDIVLGSGIVEIGLGLALTALPKERRRIGAAVAAYFVAIFPGNISQLLKHEDAFGLDTDRKRIVRLFFQPLLVLWSLFAGEVL
jgi:uncharacterized membrane protein